jgi:hypothetical protein
MGSIAEQRLCRSLQAILADLPDGATIPDSDQFREVLVCLQYFIPAILAEVHRAAFRRTRNAMWQRPLIPHGQGCDFSRAIKSSNVSAAPRIAGGRA